MAARHALPQAQTVYEAKADDLSAAAYKDFTPGYEHQFIERQIDFYSGEMFLRDSATLTKVPKPDDATAFTVRDQLIITLRSDWKVKGKTYPQGALLATDFKAFMQGKQDLEVLFAPTATSSLDNVTPTKSAILVTTLDKVKNRLTELRHVDGRWLRRSVDAPKLGTLATSALDPVESDQYFLTVTDFLNPTTLYLGTAQSDKRTNQVPARLLRCGAMQGRAVRIDVEGWHESAVFRHHGQEDEVRRQQPDRAVRLRRL
jgi:prolyl oligopeptidase